jgi:AcrR family transcriptional regulator
MVATLLERRLTRRQAHLRDALVDLVLEQGFSHLTMDQFAAQLNCSKRTLYALASSKEQLAVLAVRHFFKRATEQVEAAIARTRAPAKRVTRYLEAVAEASGTILQTSAQQPRSMSRTRWPPRSGFVS